MNFNIRTVDDDFDLSKLRDFMLKQPQFYPEYHDWIDGVCLPGITSGNREAIVVVSDMSVVGDVIHRTNPDGTIEIRNFRIDPDYRNMDLGHFLLTQVKRAARAKPKGRVITDVSVQNFAGVEFFTRNGFHIEGMGELYKPGQLEYKFAWAA